MTQYNTNMSLSSYYAYCNAWVVCFAMDRRESECIEMDVFCAESAVRSGIVFG